MAEIGAAVEQGRAGDTEEARRRLAELWEHPAVQGDPFHRCALAHYAADLEPEVADELRWDERALAAADEVVPGQQTPLDVGSFYPSLHLNLGDAHRRVGDLATARDHLARARACVDVLPDDGYGRLIRGGIERLGERLESS
ncbi:hypothetical protein [Actinomycetospora sp. CA-084318]|uniref:hypothetical protein n=1 Tax=Actinomycetospora sp. CA-084318 TaxID=3239892 RepID=UPI003D990E11